MREADVRDQAAAEERRDPAAGAVEELIGDHRSSGLYSSFRLPTALADRMYSTPSILKPKMLARKLSSDGRSRWPSAVPREKRDALAAQRADDVGRRRLAERRLHPPLLAVGELRHVVQAAAADDADRDMDITVRWLTRQSCRTGSTNLRAVLFADVAGGDRRIVLEEDQDTRARSPRG